MSTGALITDFFPKRKRVLRRDDSAKKFKGDDLQKNQNKIVENIVAKKLVLKRDTLNANTKNQKQLIKPLELIKPEQKVEFPKHQSTLDLLNCKVHDYYQTTKESNDEKQADLINLDTSPTKNNKSLKLPSRYYTLLDIFRCSDNIVSIYYNRNETCWFPKLKSGIEQMRRKRFTEKELSQMCTVYPNAYVLSFEKLGTSHAFQSGTSAQQYQMTIKPVLSEEKSQINLTKNIFNPQIMIKRRAIFHQNLINIVKKHHNKFLKSLSNPVDIDENKLTTWHPDFDLESLPDIALFKLPEHNATDIINNATINFQKINSYMSPRTQRALNMVSTLNSKSPTSLFSLRYQSQSPNTPKTSSLTQNALEKTPTQLTPKTLFASGTQAKSVSKSLNFYSNEHPQSPHLKGVSPSLVNLIREKEASKLELKMTRDVDEENKLQLYTKLPDLVRILRNFYVSENKSAISLNQVIKKINESHKSAISSACIMPCITLLMEIVPNWIQNLKIRNESFIKIDKTIDVGIVTTKLSTIINDKLL